MNFIIKKQLKHKIPENNANRKFCVIKRYIVNKNKSTRKNFQPQKITTSAKFFDHGVNIFI